MQIRQIVPNVKLGHKSQ